MVPWAHDLPSATPLWRENSRMGRAATLIMVAISTKHIGQTVWLWPVRVHAYCCRTRKTALVITEAQESRKITRQSALPTGRNLSSHVPESGSAPGRERVCQYV